MHILRGGRVWPLEESYDRLFNIYMMLGDVIGLTGERVRIEKAIDQVKVKGQLQALYTKVGETRKEPLYPIYPC